MLPGCHVDSSDAGSWHYFCTRLILYGLIWGDFCMCLIGLLWGNFCTRLRFYGLIQSSFCICMQLRLGFVRGSAPRAGVRTAQHSACPLQKQKGNRISVHDFVCKHKC